MGADALQDLEVHRSNISVYSFSPRLLCCQGDKEQWEWNQPFGEHWGQCNSWPVEQCANRLISHDLKLGMKFFCKVSHSYSFNFDFGDDNSPQITVRITKFASHTSSYRVFADLFFSVLQSFSSLQLLQLPGILTDQIVSLPYDSV